MNLNLKIEKEHKRKVKGEKNTFTLFYIYIYVHCTFFSQVSFNGNSKQLRLTHHDISYFEPFFIRIISFHFGLIKIILVL
ncbi:hypothetical protein GLOIN_2v1175369 [Rhizophagus irregularis DAOM 181602=DAOM 197198]|uniref:Uncharacterized protein n=1 Tax=Rhizophagus irregularis (strain DAOM 181602 / DAOM 197198 / MUCL 43194) TaxID=747089 RepID=A0A2P4Q3H0_RHIID|nr:hypothetical protein GLOIN_2v1175369 [Rhizophagus irregularis DAOM 181602=DAOM 197198]POG72158.1 hypothetical protein GLOIN_2v1175369 [Rhizophagus irregularis DAOM 181602=DAOM 197198]GET59050.1 hypothetical protein GLOIN_2v1175369 [Rhizophagus irregularis DAOM 181602=DAOM 197198]|eukprot:XP_025179024.1 hypothetical protein GLOIN_2v1175369 [Rhizophagus irregularis DAOM 181602=DAOM 197198]